MSEKWKKIVGFVLAFALGGAAFYFLDRYRHDQIETSFREPCHQQFEYLNPHLDCSDIAEKFSDIEAMGREVDTLIDEEIAVGHVTKTAFFYRDLNTRRFVGVNDSTVSYPASLVKLPIAIMYFLMGRLQPNLMEHQFEITEEDLRENDFQYYKPQNELTVGKHPIGTMIYHMLVYSENAPVKILMKNANVYIEKVMSDLGLYIPGETSDESGHFVVTARSYANIFRLLFNASYLSLEDSNELLDILTQSDFQGGIAKVPAGVRVASKFGEATIRTDQGEMTARILSHCGIIYKPNEPYIICVMTEGQDIEKQKQTIERIAEHVYEQQ